MTEFVKIKGSYYQLDHIIAVRRVKKPIKAGERSLEYVVRLSEEAAGGNNPKFRNMWCTRTEIEQFLRKMKGLPDSTNPTKKRQCKSDATSSYDRSWPGGGVAVSQEPQEASEVPLAT